MLLSPATLRGRVAAVSSKSFVHRQLICAGLADAPTRLAFHGLSEDILATAACLKALGGHVTFDGETAAIRPCDFSAGSPCLDCGESGSTLRFLLPVACARQSRFSVTGHGRLAERPMEPLCRSLAEHGCTFSGFHLPINVSGRLNGGVFHLPGNISSQYITGLLLALPLAKDDSVLSLTSPLSSRAYVDITLAVLAQFGIEITAMQNGFAVPGGQRFHSPGALSAEGDWSNAAFWLAADSFGENRVEVTGLFEKSVQGDRQCVSLFRRFRETPDGADVAVDVDGIPDLLPILAVVASARRGRTVFTNAARLRLKESDRLATVQALLRSLGGEANSTPDSLTVCGTGALRGGEADGAGDHRIVMAAAIAALLCREPVLLHGAEAAAKSYPAFFDDYKRLGGKADVV